MGILGIIDLLAKYDNILYDHLQNIRQNRQQGKRVNAHYLSSDSHNEFIHLCAQRVLNNILSERQDATYYSPDVSNTEQNVLLVRYAVSAVPQC